VDKLKFQKMNHTFAWGEQAVLAEIVINGKPFAEIVEHYGQSAAEKKEYEFKDCYIYNYAEVLYEELINKKSEASDNEPALMICSCSCEGCGAILVTIVETETEVIWRGFRDHQMKKLDYSVFPMFKFEKSAYQAALEQLRMLQKNTL